MTDHPRGPRVLLAELKERTSARGTPYLTGYLGAARVIAFRNHDEDPDDWKSPTWRVYVQERPERTGGHGARPPRREVAREAPKPDQADVPFDDPIPF